MGDFHFVKAFHDENGEGHSVYAQNHNVESFHDAEDIQIQDIDQLNPDGEVIIEKIEAQSGSEVVSTSKDKYVEFEDAIPSMIPSIKPTAKTSTVKPTNSPKPMTTNTDRSTTTNKPIPKPFEKEFSRQQKETETTKKSTETKKPTASPPKNSGTKTATPTSTPSSTSTVTTTEVSENKTESQGQDTTDTVSTTSTETPPTERPKTPLNNLYCLCDLHRHACDMNCCCDIDCSDEERSLFNGCEDDATGLHDKRSITRRQRSCYQSFVFFKHFETHILERTESGMLCILRDNNKDDNELSSSNINELRENILTGKMDIRNKYGWGKGDQLEHKLTPYQFGSPILAVKISKVLKDMEKMLLTFGLPASFHENSCQIREPVRFLENVQSRCRIKVKNLARDCEEKTILDANSFIQNFQIVGNPGDSDPQLMEITRGRQCNGELCTPEDANVETVEFNRPILKVEKKFCQDVLRRLDFTVFHEGIDGISEIIAHAELQDVLLNNTQVDQEYTVNFIWSREDNNTITNSTKLPEDWPRSGNPGYIVGKPVILGEKVKVIESVKNETKPNTQEKNEHELLEEERILVWSDPDKWMTILGPGICSKQSEPGHRKSVLFDYGHSSTCSLNLTKFKYCEDVQIKVAEILFGSEDPSNFEKRPWQVAAYGNSNPEDLSEWVPLTFKNFPIISTPKGSSKSLISKGCEGLISALHITIAYAFVGSVDFPQARITGVLYELGDSIPVPVVKSDSCTKNCNSHNLHRQIISVTTSVTFKDVTTPPVTRVAKWPVVSIRLPADFFYPFSSLSSSSTSDQIKSASSIVIMVLINIIFVHGKI